MSTKPRVLFPGLSRAGELRIEGDEAHHLARVMRVREGDAIVVFDGAGLEADARIVRVEARGGHASVSVQIEGTPRAGVTHDAAAVTWLQGYPKGDKLDTVVRQATELGVMALWPVYTLRSVPRPSGSSASSRIERLRAIAASAAAQCGRADVPEVREPMRLSDALAALPSGAALRIVPWEEGGMPLARVLEQAPGSTGCVVLVGPEGGLDASEVALARAHGFVPVGLGPRVLRTETVAPALLAMLSLARGDLRR